ncbi:hypothetical protein COOONC_25492 [Cooperia oncophora]
MHTKQRLAVYDRFGHLLLGSETEPRGSSGICIVDGMWRLHDKVYPRWVQPKQGPLITHAIADGSGSERPLQPSSLPLRAQELEEQRKKDEKEGKTSEET